MLGIILLGGVLGTFATNKKSTKKQLKVSIKLWESTVETLFCILLWE